MSVEETAVATPKPIVTPAPPAPGWFLGERVLVRVAGRYGEFPLDPPVMGTIVRKLARDESAWVALDVRQSCGGCHPFPADDSRGTHVLAWPDDCDGVQP